MSRLMNYKGRLNGRPVCLIANGPSVANLNLKKINCATIGLNKAWMLGEWDYYVMGDSAQYQAAAAKHLEPLFTYPGNPKADKSKQPPDHAMQIQLKFTDDCRPRGVSFDLMQGIYGNNTVTAFGLQVAFWLGADPIYIVGLDACNAPNKGHFWGGKEVPERKFSKHQAAYGYIQGFLDGLEYVFDAVAPQEDGYQYGPRIINLNIDSRVMAFERRNFDSVFGG